MGKYLYNGALLPDIETVYTPEVQKTHPYVVIFYSDSLTVFSYKSYCSTAPFVCSSAGYLENLGEVLEATCAKTSDVWEEFVPYESWAQWIIRPKWCNHDILNSDGTLYLAASEPVPVTATVPKVSPQLAFTIGKQLGRRIFHGSVSSESS